MSGIRSSDVSEGQALPELRHDVTSTTVVLGALASRDWRPMHHDYKFATERNGVADIFLNTPNQAAWFERYVTDWAGPTARIGRMKFRMKDSVFPGDTMVFSGQVTTATTDDDGCFWAGLAVELTVDGRVCSTCEVRVAIPTDDNDNPWQRRGDNWKPDGDDGAPT